MYSNRYTAVVDACVLADVARRDLLLTLAEAGMFRLRWSKEILEETEKAITSILQCRPDGKERARRSVATMRSAFPESSDCDISEILPTLSCLPDPKDHHVLAAGIYYKASLIVTENMKDFPPDKLNAYSIDVKNSDSFIADTIDLDYSQSIPALRQMRQRLNNPSLTAHELIERWRARGLVETIDVVFPHVDHI